MTLTSHQSLLLDGEDDLSDAQVNALLKEAEDRARERSNTSSTQLAKTTQSSLPTLNTGTVTKPYVQKTQQGVVRADPSRLVPEKEQKLANGFRKVEDPAVLKKKKAEEKTATAGPQWFNLPKTNLTPELKRDLQLRQMRSVLDPHRHYKKEPGKAKAPEFSQVGTIIEGPTEFYSARVQNKDRKRTFVEEVLAAEAESGRAKRKATEIAMAKASGKKRHYKAMKEKRAGKYSYG